jgi:hypothetical protein
MANSNKEYTAQADISYNTSFITPDYLEGRGDTDIKVYVDTFLQPTSNYNLSGTYLNFVVGNVPTEGQKIRIVRTTSQDARLTDYTDGSLLNAETLDKDADQSFYMAQEALDEANRTIVGASQFYYSQETPPENPAKGTLWYHLNETANELKIWDGVEWHFAAPALSTTTFTKTDPQFNSTFAGDVNLAASEVFNVPEMNRNTVVYLNGVRLRGKDEPAYEDFQKFNNSELDWVSGNEVLPDLENLFIRGSLTNTDVVTVVTPTGGYATRVLEAEATVVAAEITVPVSAGLASQYATNPEDVSFTDDGAIQYSALHYAAKAEDSATSAANAVSGFSAAVTAQESASITALTDQQALSETAITDQQALSETAVTDQQGLSVQAVVDQQGLSETAVTDQQGLSVQAVVVQQGLSVQAVSDQEVASTQAVQTVANSVDSVADINAAVAAGETAITDQQALSVQAVQDAETNAENFATSDVAFQHNGQQKFSAKYYADQMSIDIADITATVEAADALEQSLKDTINYPANTLIDVDGQVPFYSARHYSEQAAAYANQSVSTLLHWNLTDANTISTTSDGEPVIHSSTTLDLKANEAVLANDVPLPIHGGSIDLSNNSVKGLNNLTVSNVGAVYTLTFATPFDFASNYQVMASYNGNNKGFIKVNKSNTGFTVEACKYDDGYALQTGDIVITVYKFT